MTAIELLGWLDVVVLGLVASLVILGAIVGFSIIIASSLVEAVKRARSHA